MRYRVPDPVPGDEMELDRLVDEHLAETENELLRKADPTIIIIIIIYIYYYYIYYYYYYYYIP